MELYTIFEVAEILSLTPKTVRALCRSGRLRAARLSRRAGWRIQKEDLEDYIQSAIDEPESMKKYSVSAVSKALAITESELRELIDQGRFEIVDGMITAKSLGDYIKARQ